MRNDLLQMVDECDPQRLPSPLQTPGTASYQANKSISLVLAYTFHIIMPLIEGISQMQDGEWQHLSDIL